MSEHDENTSHIEMSAMEADLFPLVLDFVYTGKPDIVTKENLTGLFGLADL